MVEHDCLAAALVAALADLTVIKKNRTANAGSYSYDYADLGDTVEATRTRLAEHGIVALTPVHGYETGGLACTVELVHVSGETKKFDPFPFPAGRDAQATGSMVTYHRRYALTAALGLATTEDDDGAKAVAHTEVYEDAAIPGLRSSVQAAIDKYVGDPKDEDRAAALVAFFAEHDLPPVKRMNAAQTDVILEHLMSLTDEGES